MDQFKWPAPGQFIWPPTLIAEQVSHLVTITLPDGSTAQFTPQVTLPGEGTPLYGGNYVSLDFAPCNDASGWLTCSGNPGNLGVVATTGNSDWDGSPLSSASVTVRTLPVPPGVDMPKDLKVKQPTPRTVAPPSPVR